jgi:hypothetical protein
MLNPDCFSRAWITRQSRILGCRNPIMLEKAIVALQLLGHLAEANLPFQFLGGTSLLLRLPVVRRLSIDIDIITQAPETDLVALLNAIGQFAPFIRHEHDARRDAELPPKRHFRFFYPSAVEPKQDHILLDVLLEKEPALHTQMIPIQTPFLEVIRPVQVAVPSIEALLGDKLSAFAPTTIGIPYFDKRAESRQTDVVKQLFDTAALFDSAAELQITSDVYASTHARQCRYREHDFTISETLDDSIFAAMQLSAHDLRGFQNTDKSQLLCDGVESLQNHLVNQPFRRDEARIAAGKVACLAAYIKNRPANVTIKSLRFNAELILELADKSIGPPWAPLQKLRKINPEAFHYWWHAFNLNAQ